MELANIRPPTAQTRMMLWQHRSDPDLGLGLGRATMANFPSICPSLLR
jgi:hypothetical protein